MLDSQGADTYMLRARITASPKQIGKDSANRMQRARSMLRCSLFSLIEGKVTPYFVPLQTFLHLFLQLVATNDFQGDKSIIHPQNLTYQDEPAERTGD